MRPSVECIVNLKTYQDPLNDLFYFSMAYFWRLYMYIHRYVRDLA